MKDLNLNPLKLGVTPKQNYQVANQNFASIEEVIESIVGVSYGICNTTPLMGSINVVTTTDDFTLDVGSTVLIKFNNGFIGGTSDNRMAVSGSGEKNIILNDGSIPSEQNGVYLCPVGGYVLFTFNGDEWVWINSKTNLFEDAATFEEDITLLKTLVFQGSGSGKTTVASNNNSSSDRTITLPNKTGTVLLDSDVVDNLTSSDTMKPLSARMGKTLSDKVNAQQFGESFENIQEMVQKVNGYSKDLKIGYNFYIVDIDVPDFWVNEVADTNVAYSYIDDGSLINDVVSNKTIQIGWYIISLLETAKVDLTNYVQHDRKIAGHDLKDDITKEELQTSLELGTAAYKNVGDFATSSQGVKSDTAIQSADFAGKPFSKTGTNLSIDKATVENALGLGSASKSDVGDFATSSQGVKADTALQPEDISTWAKKSEKPIYTPEEIVGVASLIVREFTTTQGWTGTDGNYILSVDAQTNDYPKGVFRQNGSMYEEVVVGFRKKPNVIEVESFDKFDGYVVILRESV